MSGAEDSESIDDSDGSFEDERMDEDVSESIQFLHGGDKQPLYRVPINNRLGGRYRRRHPDLNDAGAIDRTFLLAALHTTFDAPDSHKTSAKLISRTQYLYRSYIEDRHSAFSADFVDRLNRDFNICLRVYQRSTKNKPSLAHQVCFNCQHRRSG